MTTTTIDTEVLVIGSGAGGALTAAMLAEAGRTVLLVEDGPWIDPGTVAPYSMAEMATKYRHGGLNSTVGAPPMAFVEGRCVGGGTEINSGLYHRLSPDIASNWSRRWQIRDFEPETLARYSDMVEDALSISIARDEVPEASLRLARGAASLGLEAVEAARAFRNPEPGGPTRAVKQTMTRTFIPRAVAAGATVMPNCAATEVVHAGGRARGARCRDLDVRAEHVFVCAGATATPALLRNSGIRRNIGNRVKVHPMIKMAARFDSELDDHSGVPMHQVRDLDRYISYGCSVSRPGYLATCLGENWAANAADIEGWRRMAVYYACIRTDSHGILRSIPGLRWPVLAYQLNESDMSRLARSMVALGELLFAAGANKLYPAIAGAEPITHRRELDALWGLVTRGRATLTTVHLMCGVPMGGDRGVTGADSFGRVWGFDNLYVNDASLLPDAPGVNPQGLIMTIAARNADNFLAAG